MTFVCPYCQEFSRAGDDEPVKSGTVVACSECGEPAVFDVQTQEDRALHWRRQDVLYYKRTGQDRLKPRGGDG